jgi:hypothetical protein
VKVSGIELSECPDAVTAAKLFAVRPSTAVSASSRLIFNKVNLLKPKAKVNTTQKLKDKTFLLPVYFFAIVLAA